MTCYYRRVNIVLISTTSLRRGSLPLSPTYKQLEKEGRKSLGNNLRLTVGFEYEPFPLNSKVDNSLLEY